MLPMVALAAAGAVSVLLLGRQAAREQTAAAAG
jgi:hypothetical protein